MRDRARWTDAQLLAALVTVALAATLVSEFPASASGHVRAARTLTAARL